MRRKMTRIMITILKLFNYAPRRNIIDHNAFMEYMVNKCDQQATTAQLKRRMKTVHSHKEMNDQYVLSVSTEI